MLTRVEPTPMTWFYVRCRDCAATYKFEFESSAKGEADHHAKRNGHVTYYDDAPITEDQIKAMEEHVDVRA